METTDKFEESAVIMLVSELAGSLDIAEWFVSSFPTRIVTFDDYFSSTLQSHLREALEKVYTILQTITPVRYLNYVLKGGEFNNFVDLFNRICEDRHILKETPSISQGVDFLCDIHPFKQYTAKSKAIAIEDKISCFCFDYADNPVKIGEISTKHELSGRDAYSPILACNTIAILMAPLTSSKWTEIFTNLATKLCKAVKQLTIRDLLENKIFLQDQIDLATGAKNDFCLESWSKDKSDKTPVAINAMNFKQNKPSRGRQPNRNQKSYSKNKNRSPSRRSSHARSKSV